MASTHSPDSSVVFGPAGAWGSGKTSVVNMLVEHLEKHHRSGRSPRRRSRSPTRVEVARPRRRSDPYRCAVLARARRPGEPRLCGVAPHRAHPRGPTGPGPALARQDRRRRQPRHKQTCRSTADAQLRSNCGSSTRLPVGSPPARPIAPGIRAPTR
ncbi:P-loop NTPase fold protein [Nocardioides zeae]